MKHLGDITKISGYTVPVVDVITGGSPCQDLSVAGKRAGLVGERSGLFMEQMRIVREMRERDRNLGRTAWAIRPRYMVWENVPGAFSSGNPKGSDFAAVIEEIIKVAEPNACVYVRVPDGGWTKSGCYYAADGSWSIAWRVHDAQFWGVPQRRKRIALVADFGGLSAPEILFERKGLSRDSEQSREAGQEAAGAAGGGVEGASGTISFQERGGKPGGGKGILIQHEHVGALSTLNNQSVLCLNDQGGSVMGVSEDVTGTLRAQDHGHQPLVYENHSQDSRYRELVNVSEAMSAKYGTGGNNQPLVVYSPMDAVCVGNGQMCNITMKPLANTLDTMHDQQAVMVAAVDCRNLNENHEVVGTLQSKGNGRYSLNYQNPVRTNAIVRRLTPLECERLQGYPDGWTDIGEWVDTKGKKHKEADSPRYKALGNSIALPFWEFLARRICAQYERPVTMASLFDGIGGFPLAFERAGAKAVWASEIEEFPIAVTKIRFPEKETDE